MARVASVEIQDKTGTWLPLPVNGPVESKRSLAADLLRAPRNGLGARLAVFMTLIAALRSWGAPAALTRLRLVIHTRSSRLDHVFDAVVAGAVVALNGMHLEGARRASLAF